jgi:hypothetical protein
MNVFKDHSMTELIARKNLWKAILDQMKYERRKPDISTGLCFYMKSHGLKLCNFGKPTIEFPELNKYKPSRYYRGTYYWWQYRTSRGLERRIKVVENVIADITAEITKRNEPQNS